MDINSRKWRMMLTSILGVCILLAFAVFVRGNSDRIQNQNAEYLYELTIQRAESIDSMIDSNMGFIRSTSYLYGETMKGKKVDLATLKEFEENSPFEALRFVDPDGHDYTSEGIKANLEDVNCFKEGIKGLSGVDNIIKSRVNGERQIVFYSPVYNGKLIDGVMLGVYGEEFIDNMIDYRLFGMEGESWLCSRDGMVIGTTKSTRYTDYFDYLSKNGKCSEEEVNNIRKVFYAGGSGSFTYMLNGEETMAYAAALESSDWILIRSFPASASAQILTKANRNGAFLIMSIIILFAVYVVIMTMGYIRQHEQLELERVNAEYIANAMSNLFEKVIRVDLTTGKYDYVIGRPNDSGLKTEGDYSEYCSSLLSQISDADNYRTVAKLIRLENLRDIMSIQDVAMVNIRSWIKDHYEYYSYKYAVTKKEDGVATEVFIIAQDVTNMIPEE
ncbi:MAG: cache domain-containing protein [Mogibacterium sp.]|nr:cache domain-containing protein [Mogibacterium sp.]